MGHTIKIIFMGLSVWMIKCVNGENVQHKDRMANISQPDKDMYVIHATVYEVGILTNKTENITKSNSTGKQESVTFFNTNGSTVDLGGVSSPVLTNVTVQSVVGLAPVNNLTRKQIGNVKNWSQLTPVKNPTSVVISEKAATEALHPLIKKRSLDDFFKTLFKRELKLNSNSTVRVIKGSSALPPEVAVQSIQLPPLLSLNSNLSNIPVPIPNTSVVKYTKVNTLVHPTL